MGSHSAQQTSAAWTLMELARRPNVYCKLSGMVTQANWQNWSQLEIAPYIDVVPGGFYPQASDVWVRLAPRDAGLDLRTLVGISANASVQRCTRPFLQADVPLRMEGSKQEWLVRFVLLPLTGTA